MLTVQSLLDELDLELVGRRASGRSAGALGPHLRARGPDPVALRRRADADHGDPAGQRRQAAGLRQTARRPQPRRARLRHRLQPRLAAESAGRGGRKTRLPALRGPLLDALHRDHREGLRPSGQRAVRGAAARHRRAAAARAAGPRRARPGGDRGDDRLGGRRHGGDPRRPRRAPGRARLPPRALLRGGQRDPRGSAAPHRRWASLRALASSCGGPGSSPPGDLTGWGPAPGLGRDRARLRRPR